MFSFSFISLPIVAKENLVSDLSYLDSLFDMYNISNTFFLERLEELKWCVLHYVA